MLNETAEYEQYSGNVKNCTRLNELKNSAALTGLNRPMTIVARHWMFENPDKADVEKARMALEAWCGLAENADEEFKNINGWLKGFLGDDGWENNFKKKKAKTICGDIFSEKFDGENYNNFRTITYSRILADAFAAGPLKNYYLACKKDFYEKNLKYRSKKGESTVDTGKDENKKINSKLKITAYYLLNKDIFNQSDLLNWGVVDRKTLEKLKFGGEKLYQKDEITQNAAVLNMPERWTENFKIIEEKDFKEWYKSNKEDWVYWLDKGKGYTGKQQEFLELGSGRISAKKSV